MRDKKIRREASLAAAAVMSMTVCDAEALNRRRLAGEDVASEALDLLPVLAVVDRLMGLAEGL